MTDATRDLLETLAKVLLRCWVIGFALMLFSTVVFLLAGQMVDELHGRWFGVTPHELDLIVYCGLGLLKLLLIVFFVLPWLAIRLTLRGVRS